MATTLDESGLRFAFDGDAVKFDETAYYRRHFAYQPEGKGVDFIALSPGRVQMIEVKNCLGDEARNQWRIAPNNSQKRRYLQALQNDASQNAYNIEVLQKAVSKNSYDIEVAKKAASTIACLYGAWTKTPQGASMEELSELWQAMTDSQLPEDQKQLQVILFLEGNFGSHTRPKTAIMTGLEKSIRKKLSWLNCKVSVIDSEQCRRHNSGFAVTAT